VYLIEFVSFLKSRKAVDEHVARKRSKEIVFLTEMSKSFNAMWLLFVPPV
jgi:hypothetical protein